MNIFIVSIPLERKKKEREGPGLKMGMDFRGHVWKRVWKMALFGLK